MEDKIDGEKAITLLHKLPESMREIINLRFIHDFSITEIAKTLDIEAKTVSVYLHRGLKKLREILEEYEQ
jgi:RNA polymerase sigma-70 factor (ECF subfamily)